MAVEVNLYLLVFPDRKLIKIGKAVDVFARSQSFGWVGTPDYAESYSIPISASRINSVEKGLHRLLTTYRMTDLPENGDGHTELFQLDVLDIALEIIELLVKHDSSVGSLSKGIEVPTIASSMEIKSHSHKLHRRYRVLAREARNHYDDSVSVSEKLRDINRLILFLYRYQFKIPFRYERQGSNLSFFVDNRYAPNPDSKKFNRLWKVFGFSFSGHNYSGSYAALTSIGLKNGMVRFEFNLSGHGTLEKIRHQSEFTISLFEKLPQRSPAYEAQFSR